MSVNMGSAVAYLELDTSRFSASLQTAGAQLSAFSDTSQSWGNRFEGLGKGLMTVGSQLTTGLTLPLVGAGAIFTKTFGDFEEGINKVSTIADESVKSMDEIESGIMDLSSEVGAGAGELSEALYQALSATSDTANGLDYVEIAAKAAKGGFTDTATAVDGLSSVMNAYKMTGTESMQNISDMMLMTQNLGKTTFGELSQSLYNVIPTASNLGVKFEEVSASMSTITSQGTPTSVATTQLRQLFVELSKAGGDTAKTFEKLSGQSFAAFIQGGGSVQEALQMLEQYAKDNDISIKDLFGSVEAGNAALQLTGSATEKFTSDLAAMSNTAGATQKAFDKMNQGTNDSIGDLFNGIKNLAISFGDILAPTINSIVKQLQTVVSWISNLSDSQKQMVVKIGLVVAAVGPLLLIFGQMASMVSGIITLFTTTIPALTGVGVAAGTAAAPVSGLAATISGLATFATSVLAPLAAVGGALYLLYQNSETFRIGAQKTFEAIKDTFQTTFTLIQNIFEGSIQFIQDTFNVFKAAFSGDWDTLWSAIKTLVSNSWESIKSIFSSALGLIKGVVKVQFELIKTIISTIWAGIKGLFSTALDGIKTLFIEKIPEWITAIAGKLDEIQAKMVEKLERWRIAVVNWFSGMPENIKLHLKEWSTAITEWFGEMPGKITEKLIEWKNAITIWAIEQNEENKKQFSEWGNSISTWFGEMPVTIAEKMTEWKNTITTWFADRISDITTKLNEWGNEISTWFTEMPGEITGWLVNWKDNILTWFGEMPGKIKDKLGEWKTAVLGFFEGLGKDETPKETGKKLIETLKSGVDEKKNDFMSNLGKLVVDAFLGIIALAGITIIAVAREIISRLISGITEGFPKLLQAGKDILTNVKEGIASKISDMITVGKDIVDGLVKGIGNMKQSVIDKAKEIAGLIPSWLRKVLDIHSPSKVTTLIGEFVGEGLVKGMDNKQSRVGSKSKELADLVAEALGEINTYVNNTVSLIEKKYELWHLKNKKLEGSTEDLSKKLEVQKEKHESLTTQIEGTQKALDKIIAKYGDGSSQALEYKNQLIDLQIEQAKLSNDIEETTQSLEDMADKYKYVGQVMEDNSIYKGKNADGQDIYETSPSKKHSGGSGKSGNIGGGETKEEKDERRERDKANGMPSGYATGTDNATRGWHWVGENGPELRWFNGGETVLNNTQSMDMFSWFADAINAIKSIPMQQIQNITHNIDIDINISQVVVRNDSDIKSVARELGDITINAMRGKGVAFNV